MRLWLVPLHRNLCYGLSSCSIPILRYISAMSQTMATGKRLNRKSTSNGSRCSFGPWWITSFRDMSSHVAEASKTILVLVVSFSGLITGNCGKYHFDVDCSLFDISFRNVAFNNFPVRLRYLWGLLEPFFGILKPLQCHTVVIWETWLVFNPWDTNPIHFSVVLDRVLGLS